MKSFFAYNLLIYRNLQANCKIRILTAFLFRQIFDNMSKFCIFVKILINAMQKYKKPEFTRRELGYNPTVNSLVIPVRTVELKKAYTKVGNDFIPIEREIEYTPFVRFYSTSERRKLRNACSLRAKEMLMWIMDEIKYGEDYLWINKEKYMEELSIKSVNTYKEAVNELVRYCFLAQTVIKDVYWINPDFFFKGDRIAMYPNNLEQK